MKFYPYEERGTGTVLTMLKVREQEKLWCSYYAEATLKGGGRTQICHSIKKKRGGVT